MLKKFALIALVALSVACDSGSVTGPTPQPNTPAPVAQEAPAPQAPQTVAPPADGKSFEGSILSFAGWNVKNISGQISKITAYYTSFDNQSLSLGEKSATINSGDFFEGSFNRTCAQVDLTYGAAGDVPFLYGFIDDKGAVVKQINADIRAACTPKIPECVESREPEVSYGDFTWNETILEGKCEVEVLPFFTESTVTQLNCHQTGTQSYTTNLKCSADTKGTRNLCKNVACPLTCEQENPPGFFDQSEEDNKNDIKYNVHVKNDGTWKLVLYATSSLSEYTNQLPDFTKDTDEKVLVCKGQGELKVDYKWKDHPSTYWWAVLYRNGVQVWKSAVVVKS